MRQRLPQVLGLSLSRPIGQTLSADLLEGDFSALAVSNATSGTIVVAERELSHIALKVGFADVLVGAVQAALKDREEAFNRVGGDRAASVFAFAMIHGGV